MNKTTVRKKFGKVTIRTSHAQIKIILNMKKFYPEIVISLIGQKVYFRILISYLGFFEKLPNTNAERHAISSKCSVHLDGDMHALNYSYEIILFFLFSTSTLCCLMCNWNTKRICENNLSAKKKRKKKKTVLTIVWLYHSTCSLN